MEKCDQKAILEESNSTLVDPALVSGLGVVKDRQDLNSEEASSTHGAKAKKTKSSEESSSRNVKDKKTESKDKTVKKHVSLTKVAKPSTDSKMEVLDQKWSEHFSRLEVMLLSKSFNQPEPMFQPVIISPAKPPPVSAVDNTQSLLQT